MYKWIGALASVLVAAFLIINYAPQFAVDQPLADLQTVEIDGEEYTDGTNHTHELLSHGTENGGIYRYNGVVTDRVTGDPVEGALVLALVQEGQEPAAMAYGNTGVGPIRSASSASVADSMTGVWRTAYTDADGRYQLDAEPTDNVEVDVMIDGYHASSSPIRTIVGDERLDFQVISDDLPAPVPAGEVRNQISESGIQVSAKAVNAGTFQGLFIQRLRCNGITHFNADNVVDIQSGMPLVGEFKTNVLVHSSDCGSLESRDTAYLAKDGRTAIYVKMSDGTEYYTDTRCANLIIKKPKEPPPPEPTPKPTSTPTPGNPPDIHGKKVIDYLGEHKPPSEFGLTITFKIMELGITTQTDAAGNFWFVDVPVNFGGKDSVSLTICEVNLPSDVIPVNPDDGCKTMKVEKGDKKVDAGKWINEITKIPPKTQTPTPTRTPPPKSTPPPGCQHNCEPPCTVNCEPPQQPPPCCPDDDDQTGPVDDDPISPPEEPYVPPGGGNNPPPGLGPPPGNPPAN